MIIFHPTEVCTLNGLFVDYLQPLGPLTFNSLSVQALVYKVIYLFQESDLTNAKLVILHLLHLGN